MKRVTNGIGLRREMEARVPSIGLNASGSYVLRSFDADEYARVLKTDFAKMQFSEEDHVVVARGTQGSLARLAKVTADRKYARYLGGKFVSVALIEGEVFSKPDFNRSLVMNPTLRVVRSRDSQTFLGILHGDLTKAYKSLVCPAANGFLLLDLEENPPPQHSNMKVRIAEIDPPEGAKVKAELVARFS